MAEKKIEFEYAEPLRIHKSLVVVALRMAGSRWRDLLPNPGRYSTVEECVAAIEEHPGEWFVDGVLR